jgi:hypothetical protein
MLPKNVANTAAMCSGAPMSPSTGMMRGTSRGRDIKVPSSRALMPGMDPKSKARSSSLQQLTVGTAGTAFTLAIGPTFGVG